MAKNLLEELLLKAGTLNENVEKRANANQKSVIKNTMNEEVRKFIKEAVGDEEEADDSMDYDEADVDLDTGVDVDGIDDMDTDDVDIASGADYSDEAEDESFLEDDTDTDMSMYGMDSDEEVIDLTNATEEEVMQALKKLPNDATIEIVKKPSFNVNVTNYTDSDYNSEEDYDDGNEELEFDMEDEDEDNEELEFDMEDEDESISESFDNEMSYDGEDYDNGDDDSEYNFDYDTLEENCQDETVYESKKSLAKMITENNKLKKTIRKISYDNKQMKINEKKSIRMIKESMNKMKQLALTNSNLAYVSRLFTEHSTTKNEKLNILEKFDAAKTVSESELTFKMLKEAYSGRVNKQTYKNNINIVENTVKTSRKTINEEKAYIDPQQQRILDMMSYKPKS